MTLRDTILLLERIAAAQPAVNMIVREDINKLNTCPDARYGAFVWTESTHAGALADWGVNYGFSLFFLDRLTEDGSNSVEVKSTAISILDNVIRAAVAAGLEAESWTFTTFSLRFADECAGAWATVRLRAAYDTVCAGNFNYQDNILII